jgi:S1-C subfamily serine protease
MEIRRLYDKYKACVVRIAVRTPNGELMNGAGFHIGNGVIVTAKHVLEENEIIGLHPHQYAARKVNVDEVVLAPEHNIDLAFMRTNFNLEHYLTKAIFMGTRGRDRKRNADKTDFIPVGGHLDDWIGDEFVLSRVLALGFPRVPFTTEPVLLAYAGEVIGIVDAIDGTHPYFLLSPVARGGFSGGPVISEWDFLLGVVTHAYVEGDKPIETGFSSCVTVEPLLNLLALHGVRPPDMPDEIWDLFTS